MGRGGAEDDRGMPNSIRGTEERPREGMGPVCHIMSLRPVG